MPLSRDNDYAMYLYTCNRCRACTVEPSPRQLPICPSYAYYGFFSHSGGGRGYVAQGILEGKVQPSPEVMETAMTCLMCGACAAACPPGFDINNFIRDLRDHLVSRGQYLNAAHRQIIESMRTKGNPFNRRLPEIDAPVYRDQELLVWLGCEERLSGNLLGELKRIFKAAGLSFGVLAEEPCCGAPLLDLGDRSGYEAAAEAALARINESGAGRVLALCPHCAASLAVDGQEVGELEPELVTLPALLAELLAEPRLKPAAAGPITVTYHDPCRLSRWLEQGEEARETLAALPGVELREMERNRLFSYCCGAGGWTSRLAPDLADFAARERTAEARAAGAEAIVTACSYCTRMLKKASRGKPVVHLARLVAERLPPG